MKNCDLALILFHQILLIFFSLVYIFEVLKLVIMMDPFFNQYFIVIPIFLIQLQFIIILLYLIILIYMLKLGINYFYLYF